jgi:hypothetical protein
MSEMSEHRVPMLGASWRRSEDPALSRDPRVRAVVGALATLPAPEPSAVFRAELRAQLVAIAPRIIAESAQAATATLTDVPRAIKPAAAAPKHADGVLARLRGASLGRPLAVVASVITVFALLLGGAVWMSQKALPGDTLYGLKRASESVRLDLAGSTTDKAKLYLEFAGRRVDEANGLASRASADAMGSGVQAAGAIDSHTAALIASTLTSADSDVKSATSLLTKQAAASKSSSPLKIITAWAPSQLARLKSLAATVPDRSLRKRAQSSAWLVNAAANRAKALVPAVTSGCASTADSDSLGVVPATGCASGQTTAPSGATKHHSQKPQRHGGNQPGKNTGTAVGPGPAGSSPAAGPQSSGSSSSTPPVNLPSLPVNLPSLPSSSLPVTVGPSCVKLIVITIGDCPTP